MRKHFLLLFLLCLCMAFGALADTGTAICMEKFMQNANADGTPKILYTGVAKISMSMRSQADKDSASLGLLKEGETVQIFGYDQEWLFCWRSDVGIYYVGRHNVDDILPVSDDVAPYGVIRNSYLAVTAVETALYAAPDADSEQLVTLAADSRLRHGQDHSIDAGADRRPQLGQHSRLHLSAARRAQFRSGRRWSVPCR